MNRKSIAKSCSLKSYTVLEGYKSNSNENVASAVSSNDNITNATSNDNFGDAELDCNHFDRRLSDDILAPDLGNDVVDLPVPEVSSNSLLETREYPVGSLLHSNKILVSFDFTHLKQIALFLTSVKVNEIIVNCSYVKQTSSIFFGVHLLTNSI